MEYDLSKVPISELASALLARVEEIFGNGNWLIPAAFALYKAMGPVACVDGIPWQLNERGEMELLAMRRRTGPYPGKLVVVGGKIAMKESLQDALGRHFRDDLGVEIIMAEESLCMSQYRKDNPNDLWMQDPGKDHAVAPVYLVQIKGDAPSQSLQADPLMWFSEDSIPPALEFGYDNERLYRKAFRCLKGKS